MNTLKIKLSPDLYPGFYFRRAAVIYIREEGSEYICLKR